MSVVSTLAGANSGPCPIVRWKKNVFGFANAPCVRRCTHSSKSGRAASIPYRSDSANAASAAISCNSEPTPQPTSTIRPGRTTPRSCSHLRAAPVSKARA